MPQDSKQSRAEQQLIALYVWAEGALLAGVAAVLRQVAVLPIDTRAYTTRGMVRRLTTRVVARLTQDTPQLLDAVFPETATPPPEPPKPGAGGAGPSEPPPRLTHAERAAQAIRDDLESELDDVRFRLTRLDDDVYKDIAPKFAIGQVEGATPQEAQAAAWRAFIQHGVTGFTDKSGRDWQLSSYVEMAVRTATTRAYNAAQVAEIQDHGGNLVFVSDDGHPCPLCFPWQNVVLAIVGDGEHPTVADATEAGLFHPNCKHHLARYLPGVTRLPAPLEWTPDMQAAYDATQNQRAIERRIRAAKRDALYASNTQAALEARHDVRTQQAKLRQFLQNNPNQLRRPRREQPNLSMR